VNYMNEVKSDIKTNRYLNGPGMGLVIMGFSYVLWWFFGPWAWESIAVDPRWAHNWAYALILFNTGLAYYHKSPLTRTIAMIQSFMLPVTASGSFDTVICTIVVGVIFLLWFVLVLYEKLSNKSLFTERLSKKGNLWLNMHTIILAWIMVAHMGLVFFIVRLPMEIPLYQIQNNAGFLTNLPPEGLEIATWAFDIGLFVFLIVVLWEQYKLGYNVQNKPWPKTSFYIAILVMGVSLLALLIQDLTYGFDWVNTYYP
jgi:hypothetical protein